MEKKNSNKKFVIIAIATLIVGVIGATYAYFQAQVTPGARADVNVVTHTTDSMVFSSFTPIVIGPITQQNFTSGSGNKSGSTSGRVTLKANAEANATYCYNAYLKVTNNSFVYTTEAETPELVLTATKNGTEVLTNADVTELRANDTLGIPTTKGGNNNKHSITVSAGQTAADDWSLTVTFVNLNSDQSSIEGDNNIGKSFEGTVYFENTNC